MDHEITQLLISPKPTAKAVVQFLVDGIAEILPRKERPGGDDRIDIGARPASDPSHRLDGEPWHAVATSLAAGEPLLVDRRQQLVVIKYRRRGVMAARMECQDSHATAGGYDDRRCCPIPFLARSPLPRPTAHPPRGIARHSERQTEIIFA